MKIDRRKFVKLSSASVAGISMAPGMTMSPLESNPYPLCIFSKCLQFLAFPELGKVVAELGFDGVDLTVRSKGHVLPENVKKDLPKAVKALGRSGIKVPMITTSIKDAEDPLTEEILGVAADSGISYYRMGAFNFDHKLSVFENLDIYKRKLEKLENLNRRLNIRGGYQNHSGPWGMVGGAVWDLHYMLKDINPEYIGVQYDIAHATAEGGFSWEVVLELITPWINSLAIKDFVWEKREDRWRTKWVPLGEGMVNYKKYLNTIDPIISTVPITLHYEYDLGGAELGKENPTMPPKKIYELLDRDLRYFKNSI